MSIVHSILRLKIHRIHTDFNVRLKISSSKYDNQEFGIIYQNITQWFKKDNKIMQIASL